MLHTTQVALPSAERYKGSLMARLRLCSGSVKALQRLYLRIAGGLASEERSRSARRLTRPLHAPCTPLTRLLHAAYLRGEVSLLQDVLHASYTPLTRPLHASYTPLTSEERSRSCCEMVSSIS